MNSASAGEAPRVRQSTGGLTRGVCNIVGIITFAYGLATNFVLALIGLLVVGVGSIAGRTWWICGNCGNNVAATSQMCPTCRAGLYRARMSSMRFFVLIGWFLTISFIVIGVIWLVRNQPH